MDTGFPPDIWYSVRKPTIQDTRQARWDRRMETKGSISSPELRRVILCPRNPLRLHLGPLLSLGFYLRLSTSGLVSQSWVKRWVIYSYSQKDSIRHVSQLTHRSQQGLTRQRPEGSLIPLCELPAPVAPTTRTGNTYRVSGSVYNH